MGGKGPNQEAKKFVFDVGWTFSGQIAALGLGFLLTVILGRWLGVAEYGLYSLALILTTLVSMVACLGIPEAMVRHVAGSGGDREAANAYVTAGLINGAGLGVLFAGALFVSSDLLAGLFSMPGLAGVIRIVSLSVPLFVVNNTLLGVLNGMREMKAYSLRSLLRSLLLVAMNVLFLSAGLGVSGAAASVVVAEAGILVLMGSVAAGRLRFSTQNYGAVSRRLIGFGTQVFLASILYSVMTYTDTLMVGYYLNDADVGVYAMAIALSRSILLALPMALSAVTFPAIAEHASLGQKEAIEALMNMTVKYSLIILSTGGVLMICLAGEVIPLLLGPGFLPAVLPLAILALGMIVFGPMAAIGAAVTAMDRPDIASKTNLAVTATNIAANAVLIPVFGVAGAAIGTAGSFILLGGLLILILRRVFGAEIDLAPYRKIVPAVLGLLGAFFLLRTWVHPVLLTALLAGLYCCFLYTAVLTGEERGTLRNIAVMAAARVPGH
jgi:O-antigen/teichoic acid export membrane protein